jgi:hypothetical protein
MEIKEKRKERKPGRKKEIKKERTLSKCMFKGF